MICKIRLFVTIYIFVSQIHKKKSTIPILHPSRKRKKEEKNDKPAERREKR